MSQTIVVGGSHSLIEQVRGRLFIIIGLFVFLLVFHIAISAYTLNSQNSLNQQRLALNDNISTLMGTMVEQSIDLRGYILTGEMDFRDKFDAGHEQYLAALAGLNNAVSNENPRSAAALSVMASRANDWYTNFAQKQIRNIESGNKDKASSDKTFLAGKSLFDAFRASVPQLQQAVNDNAVALQQQQNVVNTGGMTITILLALATLLLFWKTFMSFINSSSAQLQILADASIRFEQGDFTASVQKLGYSELDIVGQALNDMAYALQQQQRQLNERDVLEHVLQLNTILTSTLNFEALAKEFLSNALSMLNLQVAVLYLYDSKEEVLKLAAVQGFDYALLQKEFHPGEGAAGRVCLTRTAAYVVQPTKEQLKDLQVKTIFGNALPAALYFLPLSRGEDLLGVLAVGSLTTMTEKARNTLSVVSSNLSSTISNSHAYQHIRKQAEELARRSQEQEQSNLELRMQRDRLTILNTALEEAGQARSRFLSTMSHELRTPLASIIGFSQILLDDMEKGEVNPRYKKNLERIQRNGKHLLTMINDVLDLSKIDAGRMEINYSDVQLSELLHALVEETQAIALEQQLMLTWHVEAGAEHIETDEGKLHQLLLNLISNALKFTDQGGVTITAKPGPRLDDKDTVMITVNDTGIGISLEAQKRIFEAFYQVDGGNTRKYGGTGLGLSIVHQLTTLLNGDISLESAPGKGSTFAITLPVKAGIKQEQVEVVEHAVSR
jgi:two-component system, chemotaxis family, sensor kinase CheA